MEKADKNLKQVIEERAKKNKPFDYGTLLEFWTTIINTFAHCTTFKITHNDIKPSNILL